MGWTGPYYYQSERTPAGPRRRYLGRGRVAELAALLDADTAARRVEERRSDRAEQDRLDALDAAADAAAGEVTLLVNVVMAAAGYRRHKRGPWRKRRERTDRDSQPRAGRQAG
jgi:hypothetical protein